MNKEFIHLLATTYFWLYISVTIINALYRKSDEAKEIKRIQIEKGTYKDGISVINFIFLFLFIISCNFLKQ